MSDSLQPHGLQHTRLPCPSPRVSSDSCPLSWLCHPTISSCHPLLFPPSIFPNIRVFCNESAFHIRWPKYWSFSISPSNEYSGLITFRIDWFDLLAVQGMLKSLLQHHNLKVLNLQCSGDSLEKTLMLGKTEGKRRRRWQRMKWLDSVTDSKDTNLSKFDRGLP